MTTDNRSGSARWRWLALIGVLGLLLTGCVAIPNSGSVSTGLSLAEDTGTSNIAFNPEGPQRGGTQQSILRGFISSLTSATGGYAVAKQYLTSGFAGKWDPRQSVQVRSGQAKTTVITPSTMAYSFSSIASVDTNGGYTESNQNFTLAFSFTKVGHEWRIDSGPNGIVLADQTFQRIFAPHNLYFLDPGNLNLVPDLRWFPSGTAATRIVGALLQGPPEWLKGAAFSRFPEGTQLSDSGSVVTPDEGVARIDLTKEALSASQKERELMKVQLTESLRSVSNITSVAITVEGAPLQIEDLGANAPTVVTRVDSQPLVDRKTEFGFLSNNRISSLGSLSRSVAALKPEAATLSADQATVAMLGGTGQVFVVKRSGGINVPVDTRPGLIAPTLDSYGHTWSVPTSDPNAIRIFDDDGGEHTLSPALSPGSQIVSFEISREGARIAMLLTSPSGPRLVVAAIIRDDKFEPTGIGPLIVDYSMEIGTAVDVAWVDAATVATLVVSDGESKVELFAIGGARSNLPSIPIGASQIVGGNDGVNGLRAVGADSAIYTYLGSSWQSSKILVDFIATQR